MRIALLGAILMVTAACGTRLEDEAFTSAGSATGVDSGGRTVEDGGSVTPGRGSDEVDPVTGSAEGGAGPTGTGPSGGGAGTPGGGPGNGGTAGQAGQGGGNNIASDVGVTEDVIVVGNISARGGALGPDAFAGPYQGARAFFLQLNANGGVNGRKIKFVTCDDKEDPDQDKRCARNLVENEKVFAFVANATRSYAAAPYVDGKGVPDVAGIPIANAYQKFPTMFSAYGTPGIPRDGKQIGLDGKVYIRTGTYRWYVQNLKVKRAAVIYYDEPISKTAGKFIAEGLKREGVEVVYEPNNGQGRNLADPNWDVDVLQMQQREVDAVWQAIDLAGFQKLCEAMDRYNFRVKAAVSTIAGWSQTVGSTFSDPCRDSIYATGFMVPYSASHPSVAEVNAAMKKYDPDFPMRQWVVDGWAAAKLFTEAVASMGPNVTRKGLMDYLNSQDGTNTLGGLARPGNFDWRPNGADFSKQSRECFSVAKWDDDAGAFVKQNEGDFACHVTAWFSYVPVPDGTT